MGLEKWGEVRLVFREDEESSALDTWGLRWHLTSGWRRLEVRWALWMGEWNLGTKANLRRRLKKAGGEPSGESPYPGVWGDRTSKTKEMTQDGMGYQGKQGEKTSGWGWCEIYSAHGGSKSSSFHLARLRWGVYWAVSVWVQGPIRSRTKSQCNHLPW